MSHLAICPLRLRLSMKAGLEKFSRLDGVSVNKFASVAVTEKLAVLQARDFFQSRAAKADVAAFDQIIPRLGGEPSRAGDELPA